MFSSKPNYLKLRTNLRLCINRLKLMEKKKTELALKSRREIADYIAAGKDDRARIRVEHIIREDYLVEAMEIVEMLCDLLLARIGLIEKMSELDPGIEEAVATLIWVAPRLCSDIQELREVCCSMSDFIFVYQNLLESPITSEYNVDQMSLTHKGLRMMLNTLNKESKNLDLEINVKKTKVMVAGRTEDPMVVTLSDIKL